MSGEVVVIAEELSKSYRRRAVLRSVSFRVRGGEAVAVIGPNGAGKSTLLGCLTGNRIADSGRVEICGSDPLAEPRAAAACLGYVPEQPFLYGELTVAEFLYFVIQARGLERADAAIEMERLLRQFELSSAEGVLCRELSQGMGRKVAIIAALLHRPRVLILDEAFNGLDAPSSERLLQELRERRALGMALLLSSHDLQLLARLCDSGLLLAPQGVKTLQGDAWRRWAEAPSLDFSSSWESSNLQQATNT